VQPTVGEFDITQLHENTYYNVCVEVEFSTRARQSSSSTSSVDRDHFQRPSAAAGDVWNDRDHFQRPSAAAVDVQQRGAEAAALGDRRAQRPSAGPGTTSMQSLPTTDTL